MPVLGVPHERELKPVHAHRKRAARDHERVGNEKIIPALKDEEYAVVVRSGISV